jgi:hypothetical protein
MLLHFIFKGNCLWLLNWVIKNKLNLNRSHGSKNPIKFCMIFTHITYGVWFDGAIWSPLDEWTLKWIVIYLAFLSIFPNKHNNCTMGVGWECRHQVKKKINYNYHESFKAGTQVNLFKCRWLAKKKKALEWRKEALSGTACGSNKARWS